LTYLFFYVIIYLGLKLFFEGVFFMNVYITYDRYECSEWFNIYNIDTSVTRSLKKFRDIDLPSFLDYGPDDCHSFILQRVEMTKKEYEQVLSWMNDNNQSLENYGDKSSDLFRFMEDIYDRVGCVGYNDDIIRSTDGCSDICELPHFYGQMSHQDTSNDDVYDEIMDKLQEDDNLRRMVIKEYIRCNY
jgi:hypothetical protein